MDTVVDEQPSQIDLTVEQRRPTPNLRLVFDPHGAEREAAVDCEADVFEARFGDSRQDLVDAFGAYEDSTVWLALLDDATGTAVASSRLITPGPAGFRTLDYLADEPWSLDPATTVDAAGLDLSTTWDLASLSVRPRHGAHGQVWTAAICHGLYRTAEANGVTATIAVFDEGARARLASVGICFRTLPGASTEKFCGSPASTPVYVPMVAIREEQRRRSPEAFKLIYQAQGLSEVQIPSRTGFELSRPAVVDLATLDRAAQVV